MRAANDAAPVVPRAAQLQELVALELLSRKRFGHGLTTDVRVKTPWASPLPPPHPPLQPPPCF
eukprot:9483893-Pyramimonas_sp.AAC.1